MIRGRVCPAVSRPASLWREPWPGLGPVLVLDDPFSAVDPATEAEILRNLRMLAQDRVILLISHRLIHFAQFDQVLWLENGTARVADPTTMMAENPAYAQLVEKQQKKAGADDEKE